MKKAGTNSQFCEPFQVSREHGTIKSDVEINVNQKFKNLLFNRQNKKGMENIVVLYAEAFPPDVGGGEKYNFELAKSINLSGIKMVVITPVKSGMPDLPDFEVVRMRLPLKFGFSLNFIESFILIVQRKPKLIHFSGPAFSDFVLIPILKFLGRKIVVTFHGQFNNKLARQISSIFIRFIYIYADRIIVETSRDENYLKNLGVDTHKIRNFVFDGIDGKYLTCESQQTGTLSIKDDRPLKFIFIGGLTSSRPYKGSDLLIDLFIELSKSNIEPMPELSIIGRGDLLPILTRKAEGLTNIHFFGYLDQEDLLEQLKDSDMLILPSKSDGEGFGIVALEAIGCGKPVIVSKYAGISEYVLKYNAGYVVDPFNFNEIIEIIKYVNLNRGILNVLRENGRKMITMEEMTKNGSIRKTLEVYGEVIGV